MRELKQMWGLCRTCIGDCNRLELEDFNGTDKCSGYEKDLRERNEYKEWGYYNEEIMKLANELIDKIYENGDMDLLDYIIENMSYEGHCDSEGYKDWIGE